MCVYVCVCVRACVRACARACVRALADLCLYVRVKMLFCEHKRVLTCAYIVGGGYVCAGVYVCTRENVHL